MDTTEKVVPFADEPDPRLREAWAWLEDCGIVTESDTEDALSGTINSAEVLAFVNRHYDGGWAQFTLDSEPLEEWYVQTRIRTKHGSVVIEKSTFGRTRNRPLY